VDGIGEVIYSQKIAGSVFDTRVKFLDLASEVFSQIGEFIRRRR